MVNNACRALALNFWFISFGVVSAQDPVCTDTTKAKPVFSAYVDAYYAYDFGQPKDDARPAFLYQYNRHNELDLNLGMARVDHNTSKFRAALGLMMGTYAQANTINEPELLRHVHEARVGFNLSKRKALWLDAGVFASHIGLETAISIDNWTLTRSVSAENSPYYLSGAKLTWSISPKIEVAGLFVNGWQRMRRIQTNTPCFGTQVLWRINDGMKFNWSTFTGSVVPDSLGLYRVFNNVWFSWEGNKWGLQVSADLGLQEMASLQDRSEDWDSWASGLIIVRRKLGERFFAVGRGEIYTDPEQVMITTHTPDGFTTVGYSLGLDMKVVPDAFIRIEGRTFHGTEKYFESTFGPLQDNTSITVSMAARF